VTDILGTAGKSLGVKDPDAEVVTTVDGFGSEFLIGEALILIFFNLAEFSLVSDFRFFDVFCAAVGGGSIMESNSSSFTTALDFVDLAGFLAFDEDDAGILRE
jgi:hypothetical protein